MVNVSKDTYWCSKSIVDKLYKLIDQLVDDLNIDPEKIILQGHSLGGQGVFCIASDNRARFSSLVPISGYAAWMNKYENIKVPIRGYIGTQAKGEDVDSINFMKNTFSKYYGINNLYQRNVSHANIPITAFTEDSNKDNKSDLVEWMLTR